MPKVERIRHKAHISSAKVKPLEPASLGLNPDLSSQGIESEQEKLPIQLTIQPTKKEKMLERRESFLRKLGPGLSSLSKSHMRRMKRKAKEQLAGDTLADLSQALASLEGDNNDSKAEPKKSQQKAGLIGEGKSRPLSKSQRKRMLELERFRHPLILQNPEFSANPFETIQTHAKNTLLKHTPSTS